ncbi:TIGR03016 family PEP-CTERM system-associated outer membrane protein [Hydrogenophaga sp. BPS33]|uniref:TIGR03016 family PEP-CTERM system-associated outer membrane protein n=1 Tax=Hydrogenophaga sp. BPS33 TaxID=2651974 RepID=UPI00131F5E22|nr:TIGR03016 family PEP-CTERM system-associated outer membrane protein [Hydrogenophaga sp. BPS33]QHE85912.1 TIGR03016 family PEP-CTERM system-associated outer membrane protein [Hydrogenophaga sp. BPS33]
MTSRSFTRPMALRASALARAMSGLLVLSLHVAVDAQELPATQDVAEVETPTGPPPSFWLVPRISFSQGFSNNGNLAGPGQTRESEQITEISPGVGLVFNSGRLKGFLDYSVRAIYDAQRTAGDNIQQALNTNGTFMAWDNRAFIDFAGLIGQQPISAFESPEVNLVGNGNLSETSSFYFSPYLRGELPGSLDYELRYGWQQNRTDTTLRSDSTSKSTRARLSRQTEGRALYWTVEAGRTELDYSLGSSQTLDELNGRLFYPVTSTVTLSALAGVESNDLLTPEKKSYSETGLGLQWQPTERMRLVLEGNRRFFGNGHNVEFEYRGRRTIWRYTDARDVLTTPLDGVVGDRGSIYSLLDALSTESDPVLRAQQVNAELQRLGLPADYPVSGGYLTSRATVQRIQELSLALTDPRNALIVAVSRNTARRLGAAIALIDDFGMASDIREKAWRITYAHRLTPLTSINAGFVRQSAEGINTGMRYTLKTFTLGMTTRLAQRTSASLQLRHSNFDGPSPYKETSVLGVITYRF